MKIGVLRVQGAFAEHEAMLRSIGVAAMYTANDGEEAVDFLVKNGKSINLIMCDWTMPGMSGLDLLKKVRKVQPKMPFLMVTGQTDASSVMTAAKCGVSGYITKPYSGSEITQAVSQFGG